MLLHAVQDSLHMVEARAPWVYLGVSNSTYRYRTMGYHNGVLRGRAREVVVVVVDSRIFNRFSDFLKIAQNQLL